MADLPCSVEPRNLAQGYHVPANPAGSKRNLAGATNYGSIKVGEENFPSPVRGKVRFSWTVCLPACC